MILSTMNNQEIANEIARDINMVRVKGKYLTETLRRTALKSKNKSARKIFDYKSRNHNKWIIICEYKKKSKKNIATAYYIDQYGFNAIIYDYNLKSLIHFTPHFFSRYNERLLHQPNLSKIEILKIFLEHNSFGLIHLLQDTNEIKKGIFVKNENGIGLGFYENLEGPIQQIFHLKTFITDNMLKGNQEDFLDEMTPLYKAYKKEKDSMISNRFVA